MGSADCGLRAEYKTRSSSKHYGLGVKHELMNKTRTAIKCGLPTTVRVLY